MQLEFSTYRLIIAPRTEPTCCLGPAHMPVARSLKPNRLSLSLAVSWYRLLVCGCRVVCGIAGMGRG